MLPNYAFIDSNAKVQLTEARDTFNRFGLVNNNIIEHEGDTYLFCWCGSKVTDTIVMLHKMHGLRVASECTTIIALKTTAAELKQHIQDIVRGNQVSPLDIATSVENKLIDKY